MVWKKRKSSNHAWHRSARTKKGVSGTYSQREEKDLVANCEKYHQAWIFVLYGYANILFNRLIHYHHATNDNFRGEFGHRYMNGAGKQLMIHSNTIEQHWGQFKGVIRTIHHGVSRKYRISYLNE